MIFSGLNDCRLQRLEKRNVTFALHLVYMEGGNGWL
nr:MAG TPA: hypothetical protein [Caudoviricetes sp.]